MITLVHLEGMLTAPASDPAIVLTPASFSSFSPPAPGSYGCLPTSELQPFRPGLGNAGSSGSAFGFAVVNPVDLEVPLPSAVSSRGTVKAGFSH